MTWTTSRDLRAQLMRHWDRGTLLRTLVTDEALFPLRLALKGPSSSDITHQFEAIRSWAADLASMPQVRVESRETRHRVQGLQRIPDSVWIDSLDAALTILAKHRDAERFEQMVKTTQHTLPALMPWLARRPLQAVALASEWPLFLEILQWLLARPRPNVFLRQVDVPGVHTKFIEKNRTTLSELFDLALPAETIRAEYTGSSGFASRYGFLEKPEHIRFRILDDTISLLPGIAKPDIALDSHSFASLQISPQHVFITENMTNFLALPPLQKSVVIFGSGYGWNALARAQWLKECNIHYWGDIDTNGFAILDQLRSHFSHTESFLMDRDTLMAHETHWTHEQSQVTRDCPRLTPAEQILFDELRDNRIQKNLRLEQERVGFQWVVDALGLLTQS